MMVSGLSGLRPADTVPVPVMLHARFAVAPGGTVSAKVNPLPDGVAVIVPVTGLKGLPVLTPPIRRRPVAVRPVLSRRPLKAPAVVYGPPSVEAATPAPGQLAERGCRTNGGLEGRRAVAPRDYPSHQHRADLYNNGSLCSDQFLEHVKTRELIIHRPAYPLDTLRRVARFVTRGFRISGPELTVPHQLIEQEMLARGQEAA